MYLKKELSIFARKSESLSFSIFWHDLEVKCLEDGTRQMAEDVLLVGSHVVGGTQRSLGGCHRSSLFSFEHDIEAAPRSMHACMHVRMYVCMHACIHPSIHTYIHT